MKGHKKTNTQEVMGEHIRDVYRPSEKEQKTAEAMTTDEQKKESKKRESEYPKPWDQKEDEIPLFADIHDEVAVRMQGGGGLEKGREEKFGAGYIRDERLWISKEGQIYLRQNLRPLNDLHRGEAADSTDAAEKISKEAALERIDLSLEFSQSEIDLAKERVENLTAYRENLMKAREKIDKLK